MAVSAVFWPLSRTVDHLSSLRVCLLLAIAHRLQVNFHEKAETAEHVQVGSRMHATKISLLPNPGVNYVLHSFEGTLPDRQQPVNSMTSAAPAGGLTRADGSECSSPSPCASSISQHPM